MRKIPAKKPEPSRRPGKNSGKSKASPIISPNIRLRHPGEFQVGPYSIVDDFCYFSTKVRIGFCSHIAAGCTVAGGIAHLFSLGDMSSVSSGARIWCGSDDFANDLVTLIPGHIRSPKKHFKSGDVILENYTALGSNTVVMPDNRIPEGTVVGALSFVPSGFDFKPWSVYAGIPVKYLGPRKRKEVLAQAKHLRRELET